MRRCYFEIMRLIDAIGLGYPSVMGGWIQGA